MHSRTTGAPPRDDHSSYRVERFGQGVDRGVVQTCIVGARAVVDDPVPRSTARPASGKITGFADERVAERQVQVHRSRSASSGAERLGHCARPERPPCSPGLFRRHARIDEPPHRCAVEVLLIGQLFALGLLCTIVCGAATPCSSGGRSAVAAMSGTALWCASTTAGCSSTAAVPLLVRTTAGRPLASPIPSAMNAPLRSS